MYSYSAGSSIITSKGMLPSQFEVCISAAFSYQARATLPLGRILYSAVKAMLHSMSAHEGATYDTAASALKIPAFIKVVLYHLHASYYTFPHMHEPPGMQTYNIDMTEALLPDSSSYRCMNDFFVSSISSCQHTR